MKEEDCLKELIHQCDVVRQKHHTLENDLDYSNDLEGLDDKIQCAIRGEKLFQDYQVEHQNLNHVLHDIAR